MSGRKTNVQKEIEEAVKIEVLESILDAINKTNLDSIKELLLRATKTGESSGKADRLIEEFTRQAIDTYNPCEALEWIGAQAEELGKSESYEDLREAGRTNYFKYGFLISCLIGWRLERMKPSSG